MTPRFIIDFDPIAAFLITLVAVVFAVVVGIAYVLSVSRERERRGRLTPEKRAEEDSNEQFSP